MKKLFISITALLISFALLTSYALAYMTDIEYKESITMGIANFGGKTNFTCDTEILNPGSYHILNFSYNNYGLLSADVYLDSITLSSTNNIFERDSNGKYPFEIYDYRDIYPYLGEDGYINGDINFIQPLSYYVHPTIDSTQKVLEIALDYYYPTEGTVYGNSSTPGNNTSIPATNPLNGETFLYLANQNGVDSNANSTSFTSQFVLVVSDSISGSEDTLTVTFNGNVKPYQNGSYWNIPYSDSKTFHFIDEGYYILGIYNDDLPSGFVTLPVGPPASQLKDYGWASELLSLYFSDTIKSGYSSDMFENCSSLQYLRLPSIEDEITLNLNLDLKTLNYLQLDGVYNNLKIILGSNSSAETLIIPDITNIEIDSYGPNYVESVKNIILTNASEIDLTVFNNSFPNLESLTLSSSAIVKGSPDGYNVNIDIDDNNFQWPQNQSYNITGIYYDKLSSSFMDLNSYPSNSSSVSIENLCSYEYAPDLFALSFGSTIQFYNYNSEMLENYQNMFKRCWSLQYLRFNNEIHIPGGMEFDINLNTDLRLLKKLEFNNQRSYNGLKITVGPDTTMESLVIPNGATLSIVDTDTCDSIRNITFVNASEIDLSVFNNYFPNLESITVSSNTTVTGSPDGYNIYKDDMNRQKETSNFIQLPLDMSGSNEYFYVDRTSPMFRSVYFNPGQMLDPSFIAAYFPDSITSGYTSNMFQNCNSLQYLRLPSIDEDNYNLYGELNINLNSELSSLKYLQLDGVYYDEYIYSSENRLTVTVGSNSSIKSLVIPKGVGLSIAGTCYSINNITFTDNNADINLSDLNEYFPNLESLTLSTNAQVSGSPDGYIINYI